MIELCRVRKREIQQFVWSELENSRFLTLPQLPHLIVQYAGTYLRIRSV